MDDRSFRLGDHGRYPPQNVLQHANEIFETSSMEYEERNVSNGLASEELRNRSSMTGENRPGKPISIGWLCVATFTVAATLAASQFTQKNHTVYYEWLIAWTEVLFVIGCMFIVSLAAKSPIFAAAKSRAGNESSTKRIDEWSMFIGVWFLLPFLSIMAERLVRPGTGG